MAFCVVNQVYAGWHRLRQLCKCCDITNITHFSQKIKTVPILTIVIEEIFAMAGTVFVLYIPFHTEVTILSTN